MTSIEISTVRELRPPRFIVFMAFVQQTVSGFKISGSDIRFSLNSFHDRRTRRIRVHHTQTSE